MKNNSFKSENDLDIILILGSNEELFKKYVEKIHPDIIRNELLRVMLEFQIKDFNKNHRHLGWKTVFEKVEKKDEEPFKEIFLKLGKKYLEDISTQSPELLEERLRHLLEGAETNRAVRVYAETGDPKVLHKNLYDAKNIIKKRGVEIVKKDLSKVPDELPFLIPGRIVKGLTFVVGRGGVGKGAFTMGAIGAAVTAGDDVFEEHKLKKGLVFLFSEGEDLARTVLDRLKINGGDVENFEWLEVKQRIEIEGEEEEDFLSIFSLKHNLPDLKRRLRETPEEILTNSVLIIDGIGTFMGMEKALDAYSDMEVRKILIPLGQMAEKFNMAIIIIGHFNKDSNAELIRAVMASVAFPNVCRATYAIVVDEDDEERHCFIPIKWNLKELKGTGIEFKIEADTDRIILKGELSAEQVRELKGRKEGEKRGLRPGEEAREFLNIMIGSTWRILKEIKSQQKANEINVGTLYTARNAMGIKTKYDLNGAAYWVRDVEGWKREFLGETSTGTESSEKKDLKERVDKIREEKKQASAKEREQEPKNKETRTPEEIVAGIRAKHQRLSEEEGDGFVRIEEEKKS